ncbi:glycosyltransferase family 4 protein [Clostridium botulinum]|uniref:glycosyltransferase family 4 protein n=1 Tax=Clostridium botulinum TaxID=1491 RepID=UPI000773FF46|nr:glycosyltransferase family 4 protein [Clostridium botulinum]MBY6951629.1 glycosyltransferase family 4 protein [Clostridium botulinum]MCR1137287.1 glycosyltransferase family 4 protein [Clostridium botulinum]NEZ78552.1 glycosyltransferase family 1 protein [Clostridium botulinum]NFA17186.1 glycosyltransferase family 1 protein [Clostridium botulinum]NFA53092.1 glycosyltransferase family 1 protein [Clostridium botulinum]
MIKIKVLQIITGNDIGGGGKHVLSLCYYSKDLFHTVLGCIGEGSLYDKAKDLGIKTTLFSSKCFLNKEIEEYIKNNNIDIANFHGAKAFFTHYFINKKLNIPTVATVHSNYREDFLNNKLKYHLFTPLSIKGIKSFNNHICVSNYIKDILNKDNIKSKKFIVNNGIDLNYYKDKKTYNNLKKELSIEEKDFVYIMIARMHPIKNHNLLIEAFYKLKKEYKNVKLILLGDGVEEENLKGKVDKLNLNDNIIFLGFEENIEDYIKISDISILTSLNEGGAPPLVILESGIQKVPVIASNVGDISYTINKNTGFLIDPTSVHDIYDKMKEAYSNKNKLHTLGENLYNTVINKYSMESFCKSYYECYKNLI